MTQVLKGQVALVTGAGQGIGQAIAWALADAGADVAVNDYQADRAQATAAAIQQRGRRGLALPGDVSDAATVESMVEQAAAELGGLHVAVACAAYSDREPFHTANLDGFRRTIDVTMWGAFYTLRFAARRMIEQGQGGSVVVIGSPHAFTAAANSMAYNMAKAAATHMARTAALELAPHRIRVNVIHPGWIDTPGERKFADDAQLRAAAEQLPWKRLGRPDEIARGVVFLCDPASDYVTSAELGIDGGITLPWRLQQAESHDG